MGKKVVLFSGGLDSTVLLADIVHNHGRNSVVALNVQYGQKHQKEIAAARTLVKYYDVPMIEKNLSDVFWSAGSVCSLIQGSQIDVPKEAYNGETPSTYVPFRNGLFIACAASIALSIGADALFYGIHRDDAGAAYPDCTAEFHKAMCEAVVEGTGKQLWLYAPYVHMLKKDIVKRGMILGVPFELTWSCYEGGEHPCGKCGTCIDREKAFRLNEMEDPLK